MNEVRDPARWREAFEVAMGRIAGRFEAFAKADPLHLMRLFGITAQTAMRYIKAAHPERTAKLPR